ncbi:MAG TPA: phosphate/phosphite/phosphonate ABC transporter substrate-binding protein [Sulfuricella sp.]|nr:phosphate/phosphite/phosphonate ABC transporter substrate-binding protein [Sulfuricella sp.]
MKTSNFKFLFYLRHICIVLFVLFTTNAAWAEQSEKPIRFGITPAIVHDQYALLADWREYLQKKLERPVEFVTRDNYRETIELLKHNKLDFAWLSAYPFVYSEKNHFVRLLATPLYQGRPYYRAYLIVPASDLQTKTLLQLKGKVFAYADPYSNTGYLVPRYQLRQEGEDSKHFFRKTFFTWGHQNIVMAVARGLADGGEVDSFVWETLALIRPNLTRQTRVIAKSPEYGFPPIAAQITVSQAEFSAMQRVLLEMANDTEGAKLLKRLNLDGFISGDPKLYNSVRKMMQALDDI